MSEVELRSDQLAPHSVEAEQAVLGAILVNPDALNDVRFLRSDDFFIVRHAWIWDAIVALSKRRDPCDFVTICTELDTYGKLADIGGGNYVLGLINRTPSALNAEGYGRIVERMAVRRRLLDAAQQVARVAHSDETEIEEVIGKSIEAVTQAADRHTATIETVQSVHDIAGDVMEEACLWKADPSDVRGVATGLRPFDLGTGGLESGLLYLIAGRPGMGKSALLAEVARGAAHNGYFTVIFSLEMTKKAFARRMGVQISQVSASKLKRGQLLDEEWQRFCEAMDIVARLPLYIESRSKLTVIEMQSIVRRLQRDHNIGLVCIDTMNRVHDTGKDQYEKLTAISHASADWAHNADFPIVEAVQLSRVNQKSINKRPTLDALRDSGALEEDADWIGGLHREWYYANTEEARSEISHLEHVAELIALKSRDGDSEVLSEMYWNPQCVSFNALEKTRVDLTTFAAASVPDKELAR